MTTTATATGESRELETDRAMLAEIAAMSDDRFRAEEASSFADAVTEHADAVRTARDQAATALRRYHGWTPVECYRLIDVTRTLFAKIDARNTARGVDPRYRRSKRAAMSDAEQYAPQVPEWDALAEEARDVRDEAIRALIRSGLRNVEIAKITGLTEARIAQVKFPLGK